MKPNKAFSENIFDFLLNNLDRYWVVLKDNIGFIVIILSMLGGLNQIINFLRISPTLIIYYSPKQGLLDGVLFLIFIVVSITLFLSVLLISVEISEKAHNILQWISYLTVFLICIVGIIYLGIHLNQFYLAAYLFVPIYIISHQMVHISTAKISESMIEEKAVNKDVFAVQRTSRDEKRMAFKICLIFALISFGVYYSIFYKLHIQNKGNINNYFKVEEKINHATNGNYKVTYNNGEYVFLQDQTTERCIVLGVDSITKNLWTVEN